MAHTPNKAPAGVRLNAAEAAALHDLIEWATRHRHPKLSRGSLRDPFDALTSAADKVKATTRAQRHQGGFSIEEETNG